jgi:hypothetical protein
MVITGTSTGSWCVGLGAGAGVGALEGAEALGALGVASPLSREQAETSAARATRAGRDERLRACPT